MSDRNVRVHRDAIALGMCYGMLTLRNAFVCISLHRHRRGCTVIGKFCNFDLMEIQECKEPVAKLNFKVKILFSYTAFYSEVKLLRGTIVLIEVLSEESLIIVQHCVLTATLWFWTRVCLVSGFTDI